MKDPQYAKILESEFSENFIAGMKDRMVLSYYKYGLLVDGAPKVDLIASLMQRLRKYAETGNTEYLMDAANFAMMEFMYPKHPTAHYEATDASGSPGRISAKTGAADERDNQVIGTNPNSITAAFR